MPTLGEYLKKRDPEKYGAFAPEDIDKRFASALQNDEERPKALATMRRVVPEWQSYDDEKLTNFWVTKIAQGKDTSQAEQQQQRARATQLGAFRSTYKTIQDKVAGNKKAVEAGYQPQSDTVDAAIREADEVPPPKAVVPKKDVGGAFAKAGSRIPVVEDFRDMARLANEQGLELRIPGEGFGAQVIAVNPKTGEAKYALHESAHYDPRQVKGWSAVGLLTGATSPLQQTQAAVIKKALGVGAPVAGDSVFSGYGFRELGADVGEKARAAVPGGFLPEKLMAGAIQGGARVREGINRGQAAVANKLGNALDSDWLRQWGAEDLEEARRAAGTAEDMRTFRQNVDALPQQEVKKLSGQAMGRVVGEPVDIVAPTEVDAVAGPVLGAGGRLLAAVGKKALPDAVVQGLKIAASEMGDIASAPVLGARRAVADAGVTKYLSNNPSALGIQDEPAQLAVRSGEVAKRTAADRFEKETAEHLNAAAEPVFAQFGVTTPEEKRAIGQAVWRKWTTLEGRQSMTPVEAALTDVWQPYHRMLSPEEGYNPLHYIWGQNSSLAGRKAEANAAQAEMEAGLPAWKARPIDPATASTLPGVRGLAPEQTPFNVQSMKPHEQVAEDLVNAAARKGSKLWDKMSPSEIQQQLKDMKSLTFVDAASRSARTRFEAAGLAQQEAANEIGQALPDLMRRYPERYMRLDDFLRQSGVHPGPPGNPRLPAGESLGVAHNPYGGERVGDIVIPRPVGDRMKAEELRIVKVTDDVPRDVADDSLIVHLPPQFKSTGVDGMVMDRYTAQALKSMASGSETYRNAQKFAKDWDRLLGLAQAKRAITGANPGFEWRVLVGDAGRHAMSEGAHGVQKEVLALTADISNATRSSPLFMQPAVFKGQPILIDGRPATLGQLRDAMEKYGAVRGDQVHELAAEVAYSPGMGRLAENTMRAVPGGELAVKAGNKAAELAAKPGEWSGKMADASFRQIFSTGLGGRQLNPGYSAGDGLRLLNMTSQITRGVDIRRAAQHTRLLMMDFGDTNATQEALKPLIPFIKFWSSGARGALEVAKANPRNFSRLFDAAKLMENYDQQAEGGALDPRTKRWEDQMAGRPRFEQGGRERVLRWENPYQDMVDILSAVRDTGAIFQGDKNARGLGQFVGTPAQKLFGLATARDITTGRPIIPGVDDEDFKRAPPTLFGKLYGAARDGRLDNPKGTAAYMLAKYLSPAPVMTGPADLAARSALRLPSSTARSPDDVTGDISRAIPNYLFGIRQSTNDPVAVANQKARSVDSQLAKPTPKADAERVKKGREAQADLARKKEEARKKKGK